MAAMPNYLSTLPSFASWFPVAAILLGAFGAIYIRITPWHELKLIRAGNTAAAVSFAGALLGYAVVIASVMSQAISRADLLIWGVVGFMVQIAAFILARWLLGPDLPQRMEDDQLSSGIFLGTVSLAAGVLNAATMAS